ncbi:MAG: hypothetical protein A2945_03395 [Candidatus Liptonbacteria bacterium RIFCSPLOWO2_01_FULL_52_25]|uniref:Helix-turn-helix domain-containing protein n=1 Tax=Candidatus Liptonbacteria bacterium RIFCSPLOWO2_01_FULL_52_25 TaxID=1798650 RepID=A0A1G2CGL2_9BACT|nr:MAG: hypothetical protein A2945_03395 [Candidatus Liptonbacteria bacterium RIFCSPLOWO2_01_FULL_52_25]
MPPEEFRVPDGHITLKEAADLSGYAPDYVGQLIRKGKLYGRQVYSKPVWVTTEDALREYMKKERDPYGGKIPRGIVSEKLQELQNWFLSESRLTAFYKFALYLGLIVSIALTLVLFYVLSVNIERSLEKRAIEHAELNIR